MSKLRVLDLFSGIGGFSLGLERTGGFETIAFCEIEPYCRKVLAKHWPGVPIYDDVRTLTADTLARDGIVVDAICGGFPCQDISSAGKGAGIDGERSGLWSDYARLVGELRPQFAIVENVSALLGRGLDRVLGDLAALGYDAEWHCIRAADVGAPHLRDRLWIVAYAARVQPGWPKQWAERQRTGASSEQITMADAKGRGLRCGRQGSDARSPYGDADVADAECWRRDSGNEQPSASSSDLAAEDRGAMADAHGNPLFWAAIAWQERHPWLVEPDVGRVAHGVPARVDRLKGLGNAVVPQIPELIGRAILAARAA